MHLSVSQGPFVLRHLTSCLALSSGAHNVFWTMDFTSEAPCLFVAPSTLQALKPQVSAHSRTCPCHPVSPSPLSPGHTFIGGFLLPSPLPGVPSAIPPLQSFQILLKWLFGCLCPTVAPLDQDGQVHGCVLTHSSLCFSSVKADVPQRWCSQQPPLSTKWASFYHHSSLCSRAHHWIRTTRDPVPGLQLGLLWMFGIRDGVIHVFFFFFPILKINFRVLILCQALG